VNEEKLLRRVAGYSFAVMLLVLCLSVALRYKEEYNVLGQERDATRQEELLYIEATPTMMPEVTRYPMEYANQGSYCSEVEAWEAWQLISEENLAVLLQKISDRCVIIEKPAGTDNRWEIEEDLFHYQITFTVKGARGNLHAASVFRVLDRVLYYGSPDAEEIVTDVSVLSYEEETGVTSEVTLTFDKCYYPEVEELEDYYAIHLTEYRDLYEKIVVLDAGHGGKDPGAGAENYRIEEADIVLDMLLDLKDLLEQNTDIKVFCTRTTNVYRTLQERADLALGLDADLFISLHCNSFETSKRNGTEVIYNALQGTEDAFNSKDFAEICLRNLTEALGTKNRGLYDRQDLHIVRRATMPVVLVETAYLSNAKDLEILKNKEKMEAAAFAIYEAILEAYERMEGNH